MSMPTFSQDGLDTLFWGFVVLLVGSFMSLLVIANGAFGLVGIVLAILGWFICIMGISSLRRDYRVRVQTRDTTSPPPPPQSGTAPTCPTCGGALTYVAQYQRWYCPVDQKYI